MRKHITTENMLWFFAAGFFTFVIGYALLTLVKFVEMTVTW